MQELLIVSLSRFRKHAKSKEFIKSRCKVRAHDVENAFEVGDTVTIHETAPISKNKSWTLVSIDGKAKI